MASRIQQIHGVKIVIWLSFLQNTVKWLNYFHLFDNLQPEILNKTNVFKMFYTKSLLDHYLLGQKSSKFPPAAGNYDHYLAAMSYVINSALKAQFLN